MTSGRQVADPDRAIVGPNFYLAYHGQDDRDLQRKLADVFLAANPSLGWTAPHCVGPPRADGRRLRVGFVSAPGASGLPAPART
jgi:hypothetical protein